MDKKIYIVTSGEYSDYGIDTVFSTKEKAKAYIQQNGTNYNIEEYDLDEEVEKKTQLWGVVFRVEDGKLLEAITRSYDKNEVVDTCYISDRLSSNKKCYIRFYVDADSMDRAVKIASERFAAVKANEYIWLRLSRPYKLDKYGCNKYESFNVKTNEFIKE